jgi:hypothetical protein
MAFCSVDVTERRSASAREARRSILVTGPQHKERKWAISNPRTASCVRARIGVTSALWGGQRPADFDS